jgi:hypothetical protein
MRCLILHTYDVVMKVQNVKIKLLYLWTLVLFSIRLGLTDVMLESLKHPGTVIVFVNVPALRYQSVIFTRRSWTSLPQVDYLESLLYDLV